MPAKSNISIERQISQTIVSRVGLTLLMMIQSIFVTRILGPEGRGLFAKFQAAQNFFILFLGLGVTAGVSYYISSRKVRPEKVMGFAFSVWAAGTFALLSFQILFIRFPAVDLIFPADYRLRFFEIYFFACFSLNSAQLFFNAALSGRQKFGTCNSLELAVAVLRAVIFGAFFLGAINNSPKPSLTEILSWDFSLVVLRTGLFLFAYLREFGSKVDFNTAGIFRPVLRFSTMLYVSALINFLYLRVDYWLIEKQIGLKGLGVYATAHGLAQFLTFIPITLNSVMLPHLSSVGAETAIEKLKIFSRINTTTLLILAVALIAFADPLVKILYGNSFDGAIAPLRFIVLSYLFMSLKYLFAYYNVSQNRSGINISAEVCGLVVGVVGNLFLIPRFGLIGAALSSLIANGVSFAYIMIAISSTWRVRSLEFFLLGTRDISKLWSSLILINPNASERS